MTKADVRERILKVRIVPVVRASTADMALGAARAVAEGGVPIVEVTMTVPEAIGVIEQLRASTDLLIGAGTVLDAETAERCIGAGAQFLVSPGFDVATVELAQRRDVLIMAGALTPTEVIQDWKAGSDFVKIFPCGNVGGPGYIKALKAALPQIPMVPTGGVNLATARAFLEAGASALGVGGELVSAAALQSGDYERITAAARQFVEILQSSAAAA